MKASPPPPTFSLVRGLVNKYHEVRLTRIKDEILKPRGFESIEDFYSKQKILHDSLVFELNSAIEGYDLDLFILLVLTKEKRTSYILLTREALKIIRLLVLVALGWEESKLNQLSENLKHTGREGKLFLDQKRGGREKENSPPKKQIELFLRYRARKV